MARIYFNDNIINEGNFCPYCGSEMMLTKDGELVDNKDDADLLVCSECNHIEDIKLDD